MTITELFDRMWNDYVQIAPEAARVHALIEARGERIVNDHIALRTFGLPDIGIDVMARPFVAAGYEARGAYEFPEKKLTARHYEHPDGLAKVFVSELQVHAFSPGLQRIVAELVAAIPAGATAAPTFVTCGRPWALSHATYQALLGESEYAAWVAVFGFRPNHFTVDVGALQTFSGLRELNDFLMAHGVAMNRAGGLDIQGSPAELLEQSSTLAAEVEVELSDGTFLVPSCYYEFARRYPMPDGRIFHGFVPRSADRLFESTDARR